jgi:DNA repair exonuclease SbcCD ATPase subunit
MISSVPGLYICQEYACSRLLTQAIMCRAMKLADELESQMKINKTLTLELKQLSDGAADARAEATRVQKEAIRLKKLHELCTQKIEEAEERRGEGEGKLHELQRQIEDIDAASEAERRRNDVKRQALDDLRREKDVLSRSIGTAGDKSKDAEETVTLQGSIRRNLQAEVTTYAATLKTMRDELDELLAQKAQYAAQSEEAQQSYFTALEGVKLQELQMAALQRKIEEGNAKLKQQQSLYDAVKADRNLYSKNLADANAEISDMRRMYKQLSHTIDSVKGDIETKDVNLIKEHYEHHRVEKDKESLRNELTRVQKQIQSCEQILASQESEISKLNAIIAEADAEKMRQSKEYESVLAEKNLLQSQLVKRDSELAALYERLRVQKSSLANGAAAYAKTQAERDDLKARISALKGELLVSDTQTSDVKALENEAKRLEGDLRAEKMKIRALTEELERPINIHRWRALADRDPERWALLQRIHALQKRVLESRDNIREREVAIAEKEKQYGKLKTSLARQPGPDISETIASYQATLKAKTKQLRALEGELDSYRSRVEEYKRERTRINESLEKASQDYIRRMKMQRKRLSTVNSSIAASSYVPMDDASLMDISAEMAAAGMEPSTYGSNNLLPPGQAESVKNEADRILAAYADVLGDDVTNSNMLESKE